MHDFAESLKSSHRASDLPLWEECYREFFPGMVEMRDYRLNGPHQKWGIDRGVVLDTDKEILIDEKIRWRNKKGFAYDDILLEYISVDRTDAPGWVCKPLRCDYIAYAIAPLGVCYLMPTLQLQSAWAKHGEDWKKEYFKIRAENRGYCTLSVGVPHEVVFQAMGNCLRCRFEKVEGEA